MDGWMDLMDDGMNGWMEKASQKTTMTSFTICNVTAVYSEKWNALVLL
jgi:hypothetical protein